jgi:hypothetical protein
MQALFGNGFALPEISPFRAGAVHLKVEDKGEIDELVNEDVVCIIGKTGPWYHVQYVRDGIQHTGWAHTAWIAPWGTSYGD